MPNALQNLTAYAHTLTDLRHTLELLQWDQETYLPLQAHNERGDQISTLTTLIHEHITSDKLRLLLADAYIHLHNHPNLSDFERGLVRVMQRDYDLATKLPSEFVQTLSETTSKALHIWVDARKQKDFALFAPTLEKIVELTRQEADYLGYQTSPYDALLDLYEEGLTSAEVTRIFTDLKAQLVPLLPAIRAKWNQPLVVTNDIPDSLQKQLADEALSWINYDLERGRQDISTHPFTITLGHHDRRVTNRYQPRDLSCIFTSLHEGGHGLYEQGISEKLIRTPLDNGVSLGIHESQSRLWENLIGRGKPFWDKHFARVQELVGEYLSVHTVDEWYRAINHVNPSLIRVEADEVTYCLHIIIRFELEQALIEGTLAVQDLPEAWKAKYHAYLGIDVTEDAHGVLQDIHWAHGSIGYFPTYALGTIASAQIVHAYTQTSNEALEGLLAGETASLHQWLSEQIYRYGATYPPADLLKKVTGDTYNPHIFIQYLKHKFLDA